MSSTLIVIVVGALVGSGLLGFGGAVAGGAFGWLVMRTAQDRRAIAELRRALAELSAAVAAGRSSSGPPLPAPLPASVPPPTASPVAAAATAGAAPGRGAPGLDPLPAARAAARLDAPPAGPVPVDAPGDAPRGASSFGRLLGAVQRWFFGGNTIVKVGIALLFVGLAFLAKFAAEQRLLPVEVRLGAIAAAAIALLTVGWRLRDRRAGYAQVLQGGAIAVLYLTLFVAFRQYGLLAAGPVFVLLVAIVALGGALAVLQDAHGLAVAAAIGGFAAPLLVSTGSGEPAALFGYYLVLDIGIAAIAWYRQWRRLNLVAFAGTFVIATAWGVLRYAPDLYAMSQTFLAAYFALFVAILLAPARRLAGPGRPAANGVAPVSATPAGAAGAAWVDGTLLFGLPTIVFALQAGLVRHQAYGGALSALAMAAIYVMLAMALRRRPALAVLFEAFLAIATVLLTLVIPLALDARGTAGAWALEGAGLVWLGWRQRRSVARAFGYALVAASGVVLLGALDLRPAGPWTAATVFDGPQALHALLIAAASVATAFFVRRARQAVAVAPGDAVSTQPGRSSGGSMGSVVPARVARAFAAGLAGFETVAEPLAIAWGAGWAIVAADLGIDAWVTRNDRLAAWLAALAVLAVAFTALAERLRWPRIALPALGLAPLLAVGVLWSAAEQSSPASNGGWWAWPLALGAHAVVLARAARHAPAGVQRLAHGLGALVLAALGALQGSAISRGWGDPASAWPWLGWLVVPAALLAWLAWPRSERAWPVSAAPDAYRRDAAAVLAAVALGWVLLANLLSNGAARPLPYLPLVNPLDLGVAASLAAAWAWSRSERPRPWFAGRSWLAPALVGIPGFVWLNAIVLRTFHHYGGVPYRVHAWTRSIPVHSGLSLLWTVIALVLMWQATRRRLRAPWLVGAALLGAVVVKLLLVDLSGTGTIARIVSFLGVGVLMLVIGYLAPMPAREGSSIGAHADANAGAGAGTGAGGGAGTAAFAGAALLVAAVLGSSWLPGHAAAAQGADARAEPRFRYRAPLVVEAPAAFVRLPLDAGVFAHARQPAAADLRVIDSRGERVPFALLPARAAESIEHEIARAAQRYPLPRRPADGRPWAMPIEVVVDGERMRVVRSTTAAPAHDDAVSPGWLLDLGERGRDDPPWRELRVRWSGPDEFAAAFTVESSDDLRGWRRGAGGQLLAFSTATGTLTQPKIALAPSTGRFVRLTWSDPANAPRVTGIEAIAVRVAPVDRDPPTELVIAPGDEPAVKPDAGGGARRRLHFDLGGVLALERIDLRLGAGTRVAPVRVRGRARLDEPWRELAQAVFHRLERGDEISVSPPLAVRATVRYLRLETDERAEPLARDRTELVATVRLPSLVFAAQGEPPYALLAGSSDAPAGALPVAMLVGSVDDERTRFGAARLGAWQEITEAARAEAADARRAALRPWLLWSVLLVGVAVLGWMVWRLARQRPSR